MFVKYFCIFKLSLAYIEDQVVEEEEKEEGEGRKQRRMERGRKRNKKIIISVYGNRVG